MAQGVSALDVDIERDDFLCSLIRELVGALEHIAGPDEAVSYVSLVGQLLGERANALYTKALSVDRLTREQAAETMVDFKRRIGGDFYLIEQDDSKIVLGNRICPFTDKVIGRESMCMMTSNVLGELAAQNLGYARVELQETIARGDHGCRVVIHLRPTAESQQAPGRDYYGAPPLASGYGHGTDAPGTQGPGTGAGHAHSG